MINIQILTFIVIRFKHSHLKMLIFNRLRAMILIVL